MRSRDQKPQNATKTLVDRQRQSTQRVSREMEQDVMFGHSAKDEYFCLLSLWTGHLPVEYCQRSMEGTHVYKLEQLVALPIRIYSPVFAFHSKLEYKISPVSP